LRILFLSHKFSPDIGGIEVHSEVLARCFAQKGHEVHLVTWTKSDGDMTFPFAVIRNPGRYQLIKEHIWADVVFENNPSNRLSWPSFLLNRPMVTALHTWIARSNGTVSWLDKIKTKRLSKAKKVIACSNAVRLRCWPQAIVIENPYQEDVFRILPEISKTKDFVFLGRLVSDKGADLAIRAIYKLVKDESSRSDTNENLTFTIVGDGPERASLERLVEQLNLEKNIVIKGALRGEELVRCLNEHRFLLVPSIWEEPFGMVALEGMACGCVPIVSDGGGLPDAVGKAGLTFQRGNVDALVSAMQKLLSDNKLEEQLKKAAGEHLSVHRKDGIANRYLQVLKEVI
jgi:glycosyltransferase involved in cell wall biosynthesis